MKKFLTLALAVLTTVSASAINIKPIEKNAQKSIKPTRTLAIKTLPRAIQQQTLKGVRRVARRADDKATPYAIAATYNGWFGDASYEGLVGSVTKNGSVYTIDGLFTSNGYESSIDFKREGNTLTSDTSKIVGTVDYTEYDMGIINMHFGELVFSASGDSIIGAKPAVLNIDAEGTITSPSDTIYYGLYENDAEGNFSGAWSYVYAITMQRVEDDLTEVTLPEGAEPQEYLYTMTDLYGTATTTKSLAYTDGNDFYLYGIFNAWIKGSIKDGKVTFPTGQFLGTSTGYYMYFMPLQIGALDEETYTYPVTAVDNLVLQLNEDGSLTSTDAVYAGAVVITGTVNTVYNNFTIKPYTGDVAAIPVDPIFEYATYTEAEAQDYQYIVYQAPNEGTNGEYLNPEMLYLSFYYDGEVYEFDPELYADDITEATTEIPWTQFSYNMYFNSTEQYLYLLDMMFEKVGVQSVYYCGGKRCTSNVVYMDTKGNVSTVEAAGMVDDARGIHGVAAQKSNFVGYYDIAGRLLSGAKKGLVIKDGKKLMIK